MNSIELDTIIDMPLFREYFATHEKQLQKGKPRKYTILEHLVIVLVYVGFAISLVSYESSLNWPTFIIVSLFSLFIYIELLYRYVRISDTINFDDDGLALGKHHYIFTDKGIDASGKNYSMHISWLLVTGTLETKQTFVLQLDQMFAFVLKKDDVSDLVELKKFVEQRMTVT